MQKVLNNFKLVLLCASLILLTGCGAINNVLNPFYEAPTPNAMLGERTDAALNGEQAQGTNARQALESMSSYQRAHLPSPNKPVMMPAIVRLVWVPDRLNRFGDLVPAHYYYLKVLPDRPAVTDAFEIEAQLNGPGGKSASSSGLPYVYAEDAK
jgi:hypothetical protein